MERLTKLPGGARLDSDMRSVAPQRNRCPVLLRWGLRDGVEWYVQCHNGRVRGGRYCYAHGGIIPRRSLAAREREKVLRRARWMLWRAAQMIRVAKSRARVLREKARLLQQQAKGGPDGR